jgi:hypothetical protein
MSFPPSPKAGEGDREAVEGAATHVRGAVALSVSRAKCALATSPALRARGRKRIA